MATIKFTVGLPGSGKSTWAKEFVKKNKNYVRVSRDDIRRMRGEYWIPSQESMITDIENAAIIAALRHGKNVIIDATNLSIDRNRNRVRVIKDILTKEGLHELVNKLNVSYERFMDVSLEVLIKRDLNREHSVGKDVITNMYDRYVRSNINLYTPNENLPSCVIFDVDGTLALMSERNPYDWDRVKEDKVNQPVLDILNGIKDTVDKIIIFTGRDGCCLDDTVDWLNDNNIHFDDIYIRREGDTRKDSIVKMEMFNTQIRHLYNCKFVVDDRDQVVDMWRKDLGLTCFQVNYGNF